MAKLDYLSRHLSIIRRLQKSSATFNQIKDCVASGAEINGNAFSFSSRTFQRDIGDIRSLYQINIEYDFSFKTYTIVNNHQDEISTRILEALEIFNALKLSNDIAPYVHFEKRNPLGSEYFNILVHAVKHKLILELSYQKFWEERPRNRHVNPLALKESRGRWYLIATTDSENQVKTFGLDRIKTVTITSQKFKLKEKFDFTSYFEDSFGIIRPDDSIPQDVVLICEKEYGQYLKTYPLHSSQTHIEIDNETTFHLRINVTHDFIMELLSHSSDVEVIQPIDLREKIRSRVAETLSLYQSTPQPAQPPVLP